MFHETPNLIKSHEKLNDRAALIGELSHLGDMSGNHLKFRFDEGDDFSDSAMNGRESKEPMSQKAPAGLDDNEREIFLEAFTGLHDFLGSPTFTDDFHVDNGRRRIWEQENLEKVSPEAKKYYNSNRLATNVYSAVIVYLDSLQDLPISAEAKKALQGLNLEVPEELLKVDEDGILLYHKLSDEDKIKAVGGLVRVVRKTMEILEKLN